MLFLSKFFEMDRVSTTQVVLDYDLPVKYKLGGIKVHQYKTGTSFDKILQDLLNPYVSTRILKRF